MRMPKRSDAGDVLVAVEESHPELRRWQGWAREMPSLSAIEAHIARARAAWELRERNLFHVYNHAERFLGTCGLEKIDWTLRAFEIGYWLRTSCVGKGYMTEAVAALPTKQRQAVAYHYLAGLPYAEIAILLDSSAAAARRAAADGIATLRREYPHATETEPADDQR